MADIAEFAAAVAESAAADCDDVQLTDSAEIDAVEFAAAVADAAACDVAVTVADIIVPAALDAEFAAAVADAAACVK